MREDPRRRKMLREGDGKGEGTGDLRAIWKDRREEGDRRSKISSERR